MRTGRPRGSGECGQDVGGSETAGDLLVFGGRTMECCCGSDAQRLGTEGAWPSPTSLLAQTQRERQRGPSASPLQTRLGLEPVLCHWGVHRPRSRLSRSCKWKLRNFYIISCCSVPCAPSLFLYLRLCCEGKSLGFSLQTESLQYPSFVPQKQ